MSRCRSFWPVALATPLLASGCGTAGVRYSPSDVPASSDATGTSSNLNGIVAAAGHGSQVVTLPNSRVTVQPAQTASGASPAPTLAAAATNGAAQSAGEISVSSNVVGSDGRRYSITVIPAPGREASDTFRVTPVNDLFSRNAFGVTKLANSDVPVSLQNEFTDQTALRIQQAGALVAQVITTATPLLMSPGISGRPSCPPDVTLSAFAIEVNGLVQSASGYSRLTGRNDCFEFRVSPVSGIAEQDTLTRRQFRSIFLSTGQVATAWPVPACRDVLLSVRRKDTAQEIFGAPLRVADPDRLRLVPIPEKGKITMHPICGADVNNTPGDRWGIVFDALQAIGKQVTAVHQTVEKSQGGGTD